MTQRDYAGALLVLLGLIVTLAGLIVASIPTLTIGGTLTATGLITLNEKEEPK